MTKRGTELVLVSARYYREDLVKVRRQAKELGLPWQVHLRSVLRQALARRAAAKEPVIR